MKDNHGRNRHFVKLLAMAAMMAAPDVETLRYRAEACGAFVDIVFKDGFCKPVNVPDDDLPQLHYNVARYLNLGGETYALLRDLPEVRGAPGPG